MHSVCLFPYMTILIAIFRISNKVVNEDIWTKKNIFHPVKLEDVIYLNLQSCYVFGCTSMQCRYILRQINIGEKNTFQTMLPEQNVYTITMVRYYYNVNLHLQLSPCNL